MHLYTTCANSFDHIPLDKRAQLLAGLAEVEIPHYLGSYSGLHCYCPVTRIVEVRFLMSRHAQV